MVAGTDLWLTSEAAAAILGARADTGTQVRFVRAHNHSRRITAGGQVYVLKAHTKDWYDGSASDASRAVRREVTGHRLLRDAGLPAADVVAYSTGCDNPLGWPYLVTRALAGTALVDLLPTLDAEQAEGAVRAVGRHLAGMHALTYAHPGARAQPAGRARARHRGGRDRPGRSATTPRVSVHRGICREQMVLAWSFGCVLVCDGMHYRELETLFGVIGREGALYVVDVDSGADLGFRADAVMNTGSAFKVAVALEVFCQAAVGTLDLNQVLTFRPEKFPDTSVTIAAAVEMMMQVSDNGATGALLRRIGQPQVLARLAGLGLRQTFIGVDVLSELDALFARLDTLARSGGFASWMQLGVAASGDGRAMHQGVVRTDTAAIPPAELGPVTTARELASLWLAIWRDQAGPLQACAAVRAVAGETGRTRIGAGLPAIGGATFQGKGGGLPGLINNDAGILTLSDGHRYAIVILTRARTAFAGESASDGQLATIATAALTALRARGT